ncbi:STE3-domain-containing protein [Lentinus brumalis]|uniref:STE3-domain-containing protein n=1 Tax=Lentinus brumalis TaxID=2498619 RepID=A0A371CXC4_9APHY|nr:STE3-domain-containing protein [Polyporus brumalis]
MVDPTYPLFPIFAFIGFVLALVPLPWHLEAWNSATCYYMMWASLSCLNQFVNTVVWARDALDHAPVWCDISTRITIAASVGIPAASMCINQRLYNIAKVQAVMVTKAEKRRAVMIDTLICVLFPILVVALSYIVQGHRYNVLEQLGCLPALYNTLLTYFLVNWWPLVFSILASVYCLLSLIAFNRRRAQFNEFLSAKKSSLTLSRYFRLMALSTTSLLLLIPISTYGIYLNVTTQPLGPWRSWSDTHFDFGRIEQIPALVWRSSSAAVVAHELNRWLSPACSIIFFIYFGVASEARRNYALAFWFVLGKFGIKPKPKGQKAGLQPLGAMPVFICDPTKTQSQARFTTPSEALPPYDYPKAPRMNPSESFSSTISSFPAEKDMPFRHYQGLASTPSLAAGSSTPSSPSGTTTPIFDHFTRRPFSGPVSVTDSIPPHAIASTPTTPRSPVSPLSPIDSVFSHNSEQSAVSLSFTDIEAAYGARVPSFVSLEVEQSSEPPTPFNLYHVAL